MWLEEQHQAAATPPPHYLYHHHPHPHRQLSSSSSSKSYSSHSSSPHKQAPTKGRTMEEVWKDITPAAPTTPMDHYNHHHLHRLHQHQLLPHYARIDTPSEPTNQNSVILQDFLTGPPKDTSPSPGPSPEHGYCHHVPVHGSSSLGRPLAPPTLLSLNSSFDIPYTRLNCHQPNSNTTTITDDNNYGDYNHLHLSSPFVAVTSFPNTVESAPLGFFPFAARKRLPEQRNQQQDGSGDGGVDRRHKRMIKNRESAARSRARKQAYTNELEVEVAHLVEENANLRRMHEELRFAMAAQLPMKKTLQRTSTAPF